MEIKICAISDIHGALIDIPECDVLCICGDILPLDIQWDVMKSIAWLAGPFQDWLLEAPCKHIVMVWGNHDIVGEHLSTFGTNFDEGTSLKPSKPLEGWMQAEMLFQKDSKFKIHILQDESIQIMGIKFYGTPWCPSLHRWAFYGDTDMLKKKFGLIPFDTQVLLTHCPPRIGQQGIVLQQNNWNFLTNFGCQELQDAIVKNRLQLKTPMYVFSGHIHSGNHEAEEFDGVIYRNVSVKDENYNISYLPKVFTIYV